MYQIKNTTKTKTKQSLNCIGRIKIRISALEGNIFEGFEWFRNFIGGMQTRDFSFIFDP